MSENEGTNKKTFLTFFTFSKALISLAVLFLNLSLKGRLKCVGLDQNEYRRAAHQIKNIKKVMPAL